VIRAGLTYGGSGSGAGSGPAQGQVFVRQAKPGRMGRLARDADWKLRMEFSGCESRPATPSQQPVASLAWRAGNRRGEKKKK